MALTTVYTPKHMLRALDTIYKPSTFLLDLFFKEKIKTETNVYEVDKYNGKRHLAMPVHPEHQSHIVERRSFKTSLVKLPYFKEKKVLSARTLLEREIGIHQYMAGSSPSERTQREVVIAMEDLMARMLRREEKMAADAINTGKVALSGTGLDIEIDFGMPAGNLVTASTLWDAAGADPFKDMQEWAKVAVLASSLRPNVVIMGREALAAFLSNEIVLKVLDNLRMNVGMVEAKEITPDADFVGSFRVPGLYVDIYGYNAVYEEDPSGGVEGASYPLIPDNKIWMGNTNAYCARVYGRIENLESGSGIEYFPSLEYSRDPSGLKIMLEGAPLPALIQSEAFISATVLS
jgi:hypothetical protein